jgi:small ligand-binding sensory domain FIST
MTRSEGNVILELGRKPLVERLQDPYASLPDRDRELLTQGLLVGRVIDEYKTEFERGDSSSAALSLPTPIRDLLPLGTQSP